MRNASAPRIGDRPVVAAPFLLLATLMLALPGQTRAADPDSSREPATKVLFNGKDLDGWRIITKQDFRHAGKVHVQRGTIVLETGAPATGIALKGKPPRINYELSLEAKRIEGNDFFCGLTFPVRKQYCSLIIGGWGGGVTGLSNVDGQPAAENETTNFGEFKQDQWYRVRLRVSEKKIEAWIDDDQIVDLETKDREFSIWWEQEPVRPLGIATWYTKAALRKIRLKRIGK